MDKQTKKENEQKALKIIYDTLEEIIKEWPGKPLHEFAERIRIKAGILPEKEDHKEKKPKSKESKSLSDSELEEQ